MNIVTLVSTILGVAALGMMTFILTTKTFAEVRIDALECQVGVLGVYESDYTPECSNGTVPGSEVTSPTTEFWPLFPLQTGFGGAFEQYNLFSQPAEDFTTCEASLEKTLANLTTFVDGSFLTVDGVLGGFVASSTATMAADLTGAGALVAQGFLALVDGGAGNTFAANYATITLGAAPDCAASYGGVFPTTTFGLTAAQCYVVDSFVAASCAGTEIDCLTAMAGLLTPDAFSVPTAYIEANHGVIGLGGPNDFEFTTYWGAVMKPLIVAADPTKDASLSLALGFIKGCERGDGSAGNFGGQAVGTVSQCATAAASLAVLPADLTAPYIMSCLDPSNTCGTAAGTSTYDFFSGFNVEYWKSIVPTELAAQLDQITGFSGLLAVCSENYNGLIAASASPAVCAAAIGDHRDATEDNPIVDPFMDGLKSACGLAAGTVAGKADCITALKEGIPPAVLLGVAGVDLELYKFEGGIDFNGNGNIEATEFFEVGGNPSKAEENYRLWSEAVLLDCEEGNEDIEAIEFAQLMCPIGVSLAGVAVACGLAFTFVRSPKDARIGPIVAGLIGLIGSVIFAAGLLKVQAAPVYAKIGVECDPADTCYLAYTGNTLALPAIAVMFASSIGLLVSAFVGMPSDDEYSSFKGGAMTA